MTIPLWVQEALRYVGMKEYPGEAHHPTIVGWLIKLGAWWRDDETPWCGTFVAAAMQSAGVSRPKHWYRAKAWVDWGRALSTPVYGCVVVFERTGGGHVGLVVGEDEKGRLLVLGGNQSNAVSVAPFDRTRVLAYRWPEDRDVLLQPLPKLASSAASSVNEA